MEQYQQLTKLIEKALENGWDRGSQGWKPTASVCNMAYAYSRGYDHARINDLLFGDNLRFLKALFGQENRIVCTNCRELVDTNAFGPSYCERCNLTSPPMTFLHSYHLYAPQVVMKADDQRIPWLYSQVFGGQDG